MIPGETGPVMSTVAAVLERAGGPLLRRELHLQPPGPREVLVAVRAAGLCHSDLSVIDGSRPRPLPMALGHEIAAEVVAIGQDVQSVRPGDHVVAVFVPACGSCVACHEGRPGMCTQGAAANADGTLLSGARRLRTVEGHPIHHHLGVSGFADHAVLSERSVVRIGADVPWDVAALFGCAVLTGVGAVVNAAQVRLGQSVAIFGLGGVGLAALLGALAAGAWPVIAVDRVEHKLALARELGATHVLNARHDPCERLLAAHPGGVEHAIETVGSADALEQAFRVTRRGGMTTTVGLPRPDARLAIDPLVLTTQERRLQGSYLGSCVPSRDVPRFVDLYRAGRLPVDRLLSHRLRPEEINEGFERLARGDALRQVVVF